MVMRTVLFYVRELALGVLGLLLVVAVIAGAFVLPAIIWIGLVVILLLAIIAVRVGGRRD